MRATLHARYRGMRQAYGETMEEVRVQSKGRSMGGVHRRKRGLATGAATEAAPQQPFGPSGPDPSTPLGGGRTPGTRQMRSWLQSGPTGDVCGIPREPC